MIEALTELPLQHPKYSAPQTMILSGRSGVGGQFLIDRANARLDERCSMFIGITADILRRENPKAYIHTVNSLIQDRNKHLSEILSDLDKIMARDDFDNENDVRPSRPSYLKMRNTLRGSTRYVNGYFPNGTVYSDSCGGLRLDWIRPRAELRIVVPGIPEYRPYIYWEHGENYASDYNVTSESLGSYLNWLNNNGLHW